MRNKSLLTVILAATSIATVMTMVPARAADLLTLFTTPAERQLINSNRYKETEPEFVEAPSEAQETSGEIVSPYTEEVKRDYRISGITLSKDGSNMVWVNGEAIEDGQQTTDGSRVRVLTGKQIRVQITAPDGGRFEGEIGDTIEVVYQAPVNG